MKNISKIIIVLVIVLSIFGNANSQDRGKIKGKIKGTVLDKKTEQPLASATVQVFSQKDSSLVTGYATDANGYFLIEDIPGGKYYVIISYIGYVNAVAKNVIISPKNPEIDFKTVMLEPGSETTGEIEVIGEAPIMQVDAEKKTYNVEKSIVTESGTATDVLKNIPSVTVDQDGNVSLRGSQNVKILINGKPSGMFSGDGNSNLENIPANSIEKIEIISNPSAKYDPEGTSGIINIVLKENKNFGYNINATATTGTQDKYNGSLGVTLKTEKINFFFNYNFRSFRMLGNGDGYRENFFSDSLRYFYQTSNMNNKMLGNFVSGGIDYNFNKMHSLSFNIGYNNRDRKRNEINEYNNKNINNITTSFFNINSNDEENSNNIDASLNYRGKFDKNKELNSSLSFSGEKEDENQANRTQYFDNTGNAIPNPQLENSASKNTFNLLTFQTDFTNRKSEDTRFEAGYRFSLRNISTNVFYNLFNYSTGNWDPEYLKNNDATYNDYINAVYATYASKFKDFSWLTGLRLEYTDVRFNIQQNNIDYKNDYFSFFPSVHIAQKISKDDEFMSNYTRRINRPNLRFLDPFIDYSDPLNLRMGNPYLKPEYINSFEVGYVHYFPTATFTSSVYYRNVQDVINRFRTVDDSSGVTMTTFNNVGNANYYGLEFIIQGNPFKWWSGNANFSYFKMFLKGNDGIKDFENETYSWTAKLISNFSFPKIFDIQLSYNYFGKTVTAQGEQEPMQSFDIGFKKDFLNKRLSVSFRIQDLFNTQKFSNITNGDGFYSSNMRRRDSRVAFLSITFRFGTDDNKMDKRKKREDNNNNNENPIEIDY